MKTNDILLSALGIVSFNIADIQAVRNTNKQPNVILILTDDQGYGDLHCHGNSVLKTPNLDSMYEESVRFTDFHVNATSAPSRAALMTGRYARRVGVWHTVMGRSFLRRGENTIADVFLANGYRTGMFGKWHLGTNYPLRPMDRGFQEMWMSGGGAIGQMDDYWNNDRMNDYFNHNGKYEQLKGFTADAMFTRAFEFMKKSQSESNPFFVYLPISEPHGPWNTLPAWDKPYRDAGIKGDLVNFFATITRVDYNIGRLKQFLKTSKLDKNTIVIFMTDNGSAIASGYYNAGMKGGKGSMYDGGHRVPFFLKLPKACNDVNRKPREISTLAAHIDVLPTLVELCNLKYDFRNKLDGISLVPLLKDKKEWNDRTIYLDQQRRHYPRKDLQYCMMTKKWRLVNGNELYDINNDLAQENNLYTTYPDVVKSLKQDYDNYWSSFLDYDEDEYFTRMIVGSEKQEEVMLGAIDLFLENEKNLVVNQASVREAKVTNGCWFIEIEQDGTYEFELRRWPKESHIAICDGTPEINPETNDIHLNHWGLRPEGKKLDIICARLSVNDFDAVKTVKKTDQSVVFTLPLKKGNATIRSWFYDSKDEEQCVYYLYARLKNKKSV